MATNTPKTEMQFRWESEQRRYTDQMSDIDQKIQALEDELKELEAPTGSEMSDRDELDLLLAANRAKAYDMNGVSSALGRIDSRMSTRARERQNELANQRNKDYENSIKLSELQDKYRQVGINLTQAKTGAEAALYRSQLQNLATQIQALGGTAAGADEKITSRAEVMDNYYGNTTNTPNGRQFADTVDAEQRKALVGKLRDIGEYQIADELEATKTQGEKQEDKKREAAKKEKIKKAVKAVTAQMNANKNRTDAEGVKLYREAEAMADSLFRNYPSYVQLQNHYPIYKAKD